MKALQSLCAAEEGHGAAKAVGWATSRGHGGRAAQVLHPLGSAGGMGSCARAACQLPMNSDLALLRSHPATAHFRTTLQRPIPSSAARHSSNSSLSSAAGTLFLHGLHELQM
jgi:hypothetical protein